MSGGNWCPTCLEWGWPLESHRCKPHFEVSINGHDGDDEYSKVRAASAEYAAMKAAERFDAGGDYICVGGSPLTIRVRKEFGAPIETFIVHGESVPHYTATLVREGGADD